MRLTLAIVSLNADERVQQDLFALARHLSERSPARIPNSTTAGIRLFESA
jgi:hypothetical protein